MPRLTGQFGYCSAPLAHDTYTGCAARCTYCFSQNRADTKGVAARGRIDGIEETHVPGGEENKFAVHLGSLQGTLPAVENKKRQTETFLRKTLPTRPVMLSTHQDIRQFPGVLAAGAEYAGRFQLQQSCISDQDDLIAVIEDGSVPSWGDRLGSMKAAADEGITVVCRLQPFVRSWWKDLGKAIDDIAATGAGGVIVEHLKIGAGATKWDRFEAACRKVGTPLEKILDTREGADRTTSIKSKIRTYRFISERAHANGIACFAADNAIRGLGDSAHCCGAGLMPEYREEHVWGGHVTALAWESQTIQDAPEKWAIASDDAERRMMGAASIAQDTIGRQLLRRLTVREFMAKLLRDDRKISQWIPFARRIREGVWKQSDEWWEFCQKTRRPELVEEIRERLTRKLEEARGRPVL